MNEAEVINASWSHRDQSTLSLLDASQADVRDNVVVESELKALKTGNSKGWSGPCYRERREKSHQQEISRAAQLGKEMSKLRGNLVYPPSGHQLPQEKAGKGKVPYCSVPKGANQRVRFDKRMPIHHRHIHSCQIPIKISRNSAQIHCSQLQPTITTRQSVATER